MARGHRNMAKEAGKLLLRDGRSGPQNGVPEGCVSRAGQSPGPDGPMFPSRGLSPTPPFHFRCVGPYISGRANEARSLSDMRRVALASAALAFCLPAQWVAGASAAMACLTAATGRRLGASARLGVAIVASATRLDSTLSQELPHALARVMAHATRLNARLASRKCDRPRSRQSTAC